MNVESEKYLAQANIARLKYPLSDTRMAGMSNRIDEMNAIADRSAGFVWRFDSGRDPENRLDCFRHYLESFDESHFFFNLSVWTDVEALRDYVFRTGHAEMLRDRDTWVEPLNVPSLVMWPVAADCRPTVRETLQRFKLLQAEGSTSEAFGFG